MKPWLLILICCVLSVGAAQGATTVRGGLITNETWTAAGSPYLLTGDVIVPEGYYLEIQGGTEIVAGFDTSETSGGYNPLSVEFIVRGELRCLTNESTNRITFRGERAMIGAWRGIAVESTNSTVVLEGLDIRDASTGLQIDSIWPRGVTVRNVRIAKCEVGVRLRTGRATLERVEVVGCTHGLFCYSTAQLWLRNSLIHGSKQDGLSVARASIINCTIHGNGHAGIRVADHLDLANSLVTSNGTYGIDTTSPFGPPIFMYSDSIIWGNRLGAFPTQYYPIHVGKDPEYRNALGPDGQAGTGDEDLSLRATSPAIDAGQNGLVASQSDLAGVPRYVDDPAKPDRGDATAPVIDIGAYEYQPPVRCSSLEPAAGAMTLRFNTIPGSFYVIEASDDLRRWDTLPDRVSGTGTAVAVQLADNGSKRFYRVRAL